MSDADNNQKEKDKTVINEFEDMAKELAFQKEEKADRASKFAVASKELVFQNQEKAERAAELVIANKELVFQNEEKEKRASELVIANKELVFQNQEKAERAAELVIANKELVFQNQEKAERAAELVIANEELVFQNEEKEKRAAELVIANKELVFQNEEKEKRAAELVIANKELVFQNQEKAERAAELILANKELEIQNEEILFVSRHDFLTGLYNRIYFEEEKKRFETLKEFPVSIIMGDVNGLKLINDGFGHAKGDEVLSHTAMILKSCSRKNDIVARIGGDEFGIILPNTGSEEVQSICDLINETCKNYGFIGHIIYPSISIGHATRNNEAETMDFILMSAEESMYKQKLLESQSAHSSLIRSIKAMMFEKSQETEEHAERMVKQSRSIGLAMSLPDDQLNELELLSTLHDIGKMGIGADILSKPGKLTSDEWVEMRKHPEAGFRIARATSDLIPIANYILCHHERWDGKGYPQGLKGHDIPLLSRIISIVDSYDAMTNDRAYRTAMTKDEAVKEIIVNSGTQFDPEIAQLFLKILSEEV